MIKRKNKYNASKVKLDGYTFDSKLEAEHYKILLMCEKNKKIKDLQIHPSYDAYINEVKLGKVILDFVFFDIRLNKLRYIDTKGVYTALSRWKHKHLNAQLNINIEIWKKETKIII